MESIREAASERRVEDTVDHVQKQMTSLQTKAEFLHKESTMKKRFTESSHAKYYNQLQDLKTSMISKFDQIKKKCDHQKQVYINKFNMDQLMLTDIQDKLPRIKRLMEPELDSIKRFAKVKRTKQWIDEANEMMSNTIDTKISGVFEDIPLDGENKLFEVITNEAHFKMTDLKLSVRIKEDSKECRVVAICQVREGSLLVADQANRRLKQLDESYTVVAHLVLEKKPVHMCVTGEAEVAVAMENQTVLIVAVETDFELLRSLNMEHPSTQIACCNDQLYIALALTCGFYIGCNCKTKCHIYQKTGEKVKELEIQDDFHNYIYNTYKAIASSYDAVSLFVSHPGGCILKIDKDGNRETKSSDKYNAKGLAIDGEGNVYITVGKEVVKLSQTGQGELKQVGTVMSHNDKDLGALCYDSSLERVVASVVQGDHIYLA